MWVGATRKWAAGRNNRRLTAVVIHRMEGSLEGSDSYLRRERADYYPYPRLNASTHFGVGLWYGTPQIRQWVDTANSAWGWSARPTDYPTPVSRATLSNLWSPSEDLNWQVISVEVEGFAYQAWDSRTRDKVKELLRWIYRTHGNLVVMAHTDCSTKVCPGMNTFKAALPGYYGNRLANIFGTVTPLPDTSLNTMEGFPVKFRPMPGRTIQIGSPVRIFKSPSTNGSVATGPVDFITNSTIKPKILGMTLGGALSGRRGWYVWWHANPNTSDTWDGYLSYVHENYAKLL